MLIRIVRMTFHHDKVEEFLRLFDDAQEEIRGFKGCEKLELMRDYDAPNIFVTYSHWTDADALENYRNSQFFKKTWKSTKYLFSIPAVAFSSRQM